MKNYKMIITYDGTRYYGWEHQPTTDMTIQGKLESVLSAMTGTEIEVIGCLLYTSPSPRDVSLSRMPSSA